MKLNRIDLALVAILGGFVAGCTAPESTPTDDDDDEAEVLDLRQQFAPPAENGTQFVTGEMTIQPGEDKQYCFVTRYDGPDIGINMVQQYQAEGYGHHLILLESKLDEVQYPDGKSFDCTDVNTMPDSEPIYIGDPDVDIAQNNYVYVDLPDGWAYKLKGGTRILIQSHYLNPYGKPILVQDAVNLSFVPVETVTTWVAPYALLHTGFSIPASSEAELTFTCTWEDDVSLFYLGGHMHEWGTSITVDYTREDGETERIYEVAEWRPEYRDAGPTDAFAVDAFQVKAGESFTTTCRWFNDQDHELVFPHEMCVTFGAFYPSSTAFICDAN